MPVEGSGQSSSIKGVGHFLQKQAVKGLKKAFGRSVSQVSDLSRKNRVSRKRSNVPEKPLLSRKVAIRKGDKYSVLREAYRRKHAVKERSYQFDPKDRASVKIWAEELRAGSQDARKVAAKAIEQQGKEVTKEHLMEKAVGRMPYEEGDLEWLTHLKRFGQFENIILHTTSEVAQAFVRHAGVEAQTVGNRLATRGMEFARVAESARKDYLMQHDIDCSEEEMALRLQTITGFPYGLRTDLTDLDERLSKKDGLGLTDRLKVAKIQKKIRKLMEDPDRRRDILEVNKVVTEVRIGLDKISALKAECSDWPSQYPTVI